MIKHCSRYQRDQKGLGLRKYKVLILKSFYYSLAQTERWSHSKKLLGVRAADMEWEGTMFKTNDLGMHRSG